jgi:hypothetical protein
MIINSILLLIILLQFFITMSNILLGILGFVGLTAILTFFSFRQKQSSWEGEVIGKHHEEAYSDDNGSSPEKYKVTFKTNTGKKVTVDVFQKEYDNYKIGDKAQKKKGDYFPTKLG